MRYMEGNAKKLSQLQGTVVEPMIPQRLVDTPPDISQA